MSNRGSASTKPTPSVLGSAPTSNVRSTRPKQKSPTPAPPVQRSGPPQKPYSQRSDPHDASPEHALPRSSVAGSKHAGTSASSTIAMRSVIEHLAVDPHLQRIDDQQIAAFFAARHRHHE